MPMDDLARFESAKLRWMSGGDVPTAPDLSGPAAQLRELALAGQFRQTCLRPTLPETARPVPNYPRLALPLLPENLRPIFRRLLCPAQSRDYMQALIGFMASRGVMAHPFDWLPPRDTDGYPDIYIPLAKWHASEDAETITPDLTEDNWSDLFPAERRLAFEILRQVDAAAARDLMVAKAGTVPAEERMRLVGLFAVNLGHDDQGYLEGLVASDRSGKVKTAARQLLARLGVDGEDDGAHELADFLEVSSKGLLRRNSVITFRKKLNDVQRRRAFALLDTVSLLQLANALDHSPAQVIAAWTVDEHPLIGPFIGCLARTATKDQILAYWERLSAAKTAGFLYLGQIAPRLNRAHILDLSAGLLKQGRLIDLNALLMVTGPDLDPRICDLLLATDEVRDILGGATVASGTDMPGDTKDHQALTVLEPALRALGLLLSSTHAIRVLETLKGAGFHSAHPILYSLTFNIGLKGPPS
ncbi:DUF5691 domain-containing protein [Actibacterium sp. 188UL27-1]|uniref:DUF5691 domain-containing protein n=1 Tax=Actibacterium sp. 188UL27-1 TaxID=2786961 RepID=UPI00195B641B|nr:DUF5691 domain-containing protein [Actibacterium sp. 188UL27-1]MBM7065983.1 hypothetical protein [Actibacterium sp. 188UL27-1]